MTKLDQIYKCNQCGNMVEVVHTGDGELVCCGQPMVLVEEGVTDGAKEKHVPVIEKKDNGYHVKVGSARHPMENKHFIEWIELVSDGNVHRRYLSPDEEPEVFFADIDGNNVTARAYCNLHGLWKSDSKA